MDNQLIQFDIIGLHGVQDYSIKIKDNKAIIVGENGSGKTTIIKMMYSTVSCDWDYLLTFDFDKVIVHFSNNVSVSVAHDLLNSIYEIDEVDRVFRFVDVRLSRHRRNEGAIIKYVIEARREVETTGESDFEKMYSSTPFPYRYIKDIVDSETVAKLYDITTKIEESINATILYLPTYRRIEEQLKNIFPNIDTNELGHKRRFDRDKQVIELVEFGMGDVENAVSNYQDYLNNFSRAQQNKLTLGYLSEIISEEYKKVNIKSIQRLKKEQIDDILKRIEQNILSDKKKEEISSILLKAKDALSSQENVREMIIYHYFLKLIDFDKELRDEELLLLKFIETCNKYLVSNTLHYDKQKFACKIVNNHLKTGDRQNELRFQDLSSGEKQIVSLFSHLNLTKSKKIFVFIDEPELSLSVDWQRMILVDIVHSASCVGLIATTHSPFVFDNELEKYVYGINEFCTRG